MPPSHNYTGNGTNERAKGYEGWLASRPREESGYAPKRAFTEAERDEKVFNGAESTQEYSKMRRALREVEDNMIVGNPALGARYDEKVFGTAEPTNGYSRMKQTVREKDENMFGSKEDRFDNKIYSIEAMHELLNMRQAARQKEINSSLNDNKYGGNTYTPKVGRGHMNMSQEPRQKEHMYAPSPFLSDNDGHNPNMYSAEPGRGYTIPKHGARQKEDAYPFSPVIDDDEYRHIDYSAEAGKGYTIIRQTVRRKQDVVFALNPVISDGDEYGHMVFVKPPPVMESTNTRKAVACGPWGGASGDRFDDGAYTGIREIILTRAGGIVSIQVCYDMEGRAVWGSKNGGNHGVQVDKIALDYPSEYLTHITGYYGSTVLRGPTIIKSLTFHTNRCKYGPFGDEHGISFSSAGSPESKIVGFNGKIKGWNVTSIGVHAMEAKSPQPALDLLSMIGVKTYEVGRAREPDRWYAERVYMKMV